MRRADHDLDVPVDCPETLYGLQPIPAWWHPHVHERHAVGTSFLERTARHVDPFLSLEGRVDLERWSIDGSCDRLPEQGRFRSHQLVLRGPLGCRSQNLQEILVNR